MYVWNRCVIESRNIYKTANTTVKCGELEKMLTNLRQTLVDTTTNEHWLKQGSSVVQQQMVQNFHQALRQGVKGLATLKKMKTSPGTKKPYVRGMPKLKKRSKWSNPSMNYTANGFRIKNNKLHLAGGIVTTLIMSRPLPSTPKSVRVYWYNNSWWASFVVDVDLQKLPSTGNSIGIDWGVKTPAITTSNNLDLQYSGHFRKQKHRLAVKQRKQSLLFRKAKKSGWGVIEAEAYRKAKIATAKLHAKVAASRKDEAIKWVNKIVDSYDIIAVEDFKPKFLAKSTMASKAADNAVGLLKKELVSRALRADRIVVLVPPYGTTQNCSLCGAKAKQRLELSDRTYNCVCGNSMCRDKNAAQNILISGKGLLSASVEQQAGLVLYGHTVLIRDES
jgi:putative transposase